MTTTHAINGHMAAAARTLILSDQEASGIGYDGTLSDSTKLKTIPYYFDGKNRRMHLIPSGFELLIRRLLQLDSSLSFAA
jgi:hypothetical protein